MFRLELPEIFTGKEGKDFRQWVRRFEVAVASLDGSSAQKHSLLPSRLAGSAFTVWESLPESDEKDFEKVKTVLSEVFGRTSYLTNFCSCITARSRLPSEPIEVFSAAISTLVGEAFPCNAPLATTSYNKITEKELPHCQGGHLRPFEK